MKKLVLTSLVAVFAASAAHAANVINGDPLYRPGENRFYSVTSLASHSENTDTWTLGEEFGYGITNRLAVVLNTTATERDGFDYMSWNDFGLGLNFRALDMGNWKADVYGKYTVNGVYPDHKPFLDEDDTIYTWTAGVRGGYTTGAWTIAGHVAFDYMNAESFNWDEDGIHFIRAGVDGLYSIDNNWALVAGVEYTGVLDDKVDGVKMKNEGKWAGTFGVNYNIDATKFVGLYVRGDLNHEEKNGVRKSGWEIQDGFGFGAKFGIDF